MEEDKSPKKKLTKQQALSKAQHYCAYQERSQQEVRDKLYSWGLYSNDVEATIADLIEENFINEERFAIAYALGKFRIKHWGKIKIKHHLKAKGVPEKLIQQALRQIDPEEYEEKIGKIAETKIHSLQNQDMIHIRTKTYNYLLSKGYEMDIIRDILNEKLSK